MPLKIYYMTFGCKVNQYETNHIAELFAKDGHVKTQQLTDADVCIVNSCTVTAQADTKLRHFLKRARREAPDSVIALAGCFPQAFSDKAQELSECDIICGTKNKSAIPELVYKKLAERSPDRLISVEPHGARSDFEPMCNTDDSDKTRAYIKIQDGCDMYCSYCIIPFARGHICSKPLEDIRLEAAALVKSGHKELILTGINICCYGRDLNDGSRLIDAIEAACSADGEYRVRLGSIEPEMLSDIDIERMAAQPKLCPQFHLSLQSGCDRILRLMNRHYNTQEYITFCNKLRRAFPGCAITTDIMVGFPQETEEDFAESLAFAEKLCFASAHIFPYSRRSGTSADKMNGQLDNKTKSNRASRMAEVCKKTQFEYNRSFIGRTVDVLFERENCAEYHQGHTPQYILVKVPRTGDETLRRRLLTVRITEAFAEYCLGELVQAASPKTR